ncbi:putative nucleotidyl transferase [Aeropyrum pernix]|uniref:Putative nucleotidyl transferase n=1 Tax=Aeropyrum pernix TaxID=56636 RepID=A0A401H902_AERPX|nr:putative nucleotidyl transferase [Aeropyrum pernix]
MEAVVLAGGVGRRLLPLTRERPKPYLPLAGKPLYMYAVEQVAMVRGLLDRAVMVTPPGHPTPPGSLPSWLDTVEQRGEGVEAGLATALKRLGGGEEIVVSFVGYLARPNTLVRHVLDFYSVTRYKLVLALAPVTRGSESFGFVDADPSTGRVLGFSGSREEWMAGRGRVFAGVLASDPEALEVLAGEGFVEGINSLARRGLVGSVVWPGEWLEVGYPCDLLEAPGLVVEARAAVVSAKARVARSSVIQGGVVIEEDAEVGEGTVVEGPAYIGRGAVVGRNSVVGPGVVLEEDAVVGDLVSIERSVMLERAEVSGPSRLEGAVIGDGAYIAPLATATNQEGCTVVAPKTRLGPRATLEPGKTYS